jgi:hypothetical protein
MVHTHPTQHLHYMKLTILSIFKKRFNHSKTSLYEQTIRPSDHCLLAKLVPTFAGRGRHMVSVTDPYGRILDFLDWSHYVFFQVAPQLYS